MKEIKKYIVIQSAVLVYSLSTIPSKLASNESFLSVKFCVYYGLIVFLLGIYAIIWQQILKRTPLTIAYINKATTIIWSMVIGRVVFSEKITFINIIGAFIVLIGIIITIKGEQENE